MSEGEHWCTNPDLMDFKDYIMSTYIPLLAHSQIVEAAVKDLTLYKTSNREEDTSSFMASIRSFLLLVLSNA